MNADTTYFFTSGGYSVHMPVVLAFVAMERATNRLVTVQSVSQHFEISKHVVSKYIVPFFPDAFTLVRRVGPIPERNHAPIRSPRAPAAPSSSPSGRGRPARKGHGPNIATNTTTSVPALPAPPPIYPDVTLVDSTPLRPPPQEITQDTQDFWESVLGDTFYTLGMGMSPAATAARN